MAAHARLRRAAGLPARPADELRRPADTAASRSRGPGRRRVARRVARRPAVARYTGAMKIASWNVNSLNVRLPHLQQWLQDSAPDVVALQETKLEDERFPDTALAALGSRS